MILAILFRSFSFLAKKPC